VEKERSDFQVVRTLQQMQNKFYYQAKLNSLSQTQNALELWNFGTEVILLLFLLNNILYYY
jgi:hypothetical protein